MGKKGSNKNTPTTTHGSQLSVSIREASTGKKQHTNVKSSLKLQHIKSLATWATRDAAIPSLGAFFGHHFAASSEALAIPVDPSLLTCQRCESILQAGYNCTIRIEKNKTTTRRKGKKASCYPQNNIVYTCHFCSHQNMKRGTPRNTSQPKPNPNKSTKQKTGNTVSSDKGKLGIVEISETLKAANRIEDDNLRGKMGISEISETVEVKNESTASDPVTPLTKPALTLLESKTRKRNRSGAKKTVNMESNSEAQNGEKSDNVSNRRRRKSWTSLKEIAESNENDNSRRLMNLTIPFFMQ